MRVFFFSEFAVEFHDIKCKTSSQVIFSFRYIMSRGLDEGRLVRLVEVMFDGKNHTDACVLLSADSTYNYYVFAR
jgi:hypothetical protein